VPIDLEHGFAAGGSLWDKVPWITCREVNPDITDAWRSLREAAVAQEEAAAAHTELQRVKKQAAEQEAETKAKAAEVVSKANKYSRTPQPELKGKPGSAGKSMRRFLSAKELGQYTAEQCVVAVSEQYSRSKSKRRSLQPAQKLVLRRQKRCDRKLEEGTLKDPVTGQPVTLILSSSAYFEHLWEDYKKAWKAEYEEDGVTPVSKSEIRKLLFALQRSRCYWGLSPIAYFHHLQEQQAVT
jgi:hypothetical protein